MRLLFLGAILWGCSSGLVLRIQASPQVNLDLNAEPSPVALWVYQLSDSGSFLQDDFQQLMRVEPNNASEVLGFEKVSIEPAHARTLWLKLNPKTRYLGFVAAYRDLDASHWRSLVALSSLGNNGVFWHSIPVQLDEFGLRLQGGS